MGLKSRGKCVTALFNFMSATPLISPRRYFASAQRVGRTGRHASLRPSRPAVFPCCFLAMTATATSSPVFARLVDYASFVVYVRPTRIATLQATLHAVAADRAGLRRRQRAVWKYRSMLDWTDIGADGAFHTHAVVRSRCSQSLIMQSVVEGVKCVNCVVPVWRV